MFLLPMPSNKEVPMDISKRYSIELNKISNHPADLEKGHIYELTKTPEIGRAHV